MRPRRRSASLSAKDIADVIEITRITPATGIQAVDNIAIIWGGFPQGVKAIRPHQTVATEGIEFL